MNLGDKIKRLREQNDLTLEQLAEKIEVAPELISEWETKETFPELDKLLWLSQLFGVPTDYLLSENDVNVGSKDLLLPYEMDIPNNKYNIRFSLGIVLLALGSLSVLIFLMLLAFNPVVFDQSGQQTSGFQEYLTAYPGTKLLLIISVVIIIIGTVLMTYKQIQKLIKIHMAKKNEG
jgi:transcriptional regulator with XRE-family HTH domain